MLCRASAQPAGVPPGSWPLFQLGVCIVRLDETDCLRLPTHVSHVENRDLHHWRHKYEFGQLVMGESIPVISPLRQGGLVVVYPGKGPLVTPDPNSMKHRLFGASM